MDVVFNELTVSCRLYTSAKEGDGSAVQLCVLFYLAGELYTQLTHSCSACTVTCSPSHKMEEESSNLL